MKEIKLTTQLNLIFTIVTLLTSLVFIIALNRAFSSFREEQNAFQLNSYLQEIELNLLNPPTTNEYNGYIIVENGQVVRMYNFEILNNNYTPSTLYNKLRVVPGTSLEENISGENYYYRMSRRSSNSMTIVFTSEDYLQSFGNSFSLLMRISFIALVLLGNLIILMWSRITVDRVRRIQSEVALLSKNNYQVPIDIDGNDEISELARTIERMRQEIQHSEKTKQEMLQNISHDFKTPIAVIQSYAEAISDGISEISEADVIVRQADILNQKVKQLLELNKLEYLKDQNEFEDVVLKDIIINIVNNQKYRSNQIEFKLDLDDSTYFGVKENFYTAFNNIIDNAMRYAQTEIVIILQNKKLTFYNDGEPISERFINQIFKPYEKGQKGQFGLGMSIVQKTCAYFNLQLKVENVDKGVMITIEPLL
ncbi:MAG: HAMP domain-containing histidine kinase [Tenericutes bacterium]|jgi:two-component system, OmpR family, sensor histidine kinase CssS|nr:HAMP domain-containing histidine kinase [Mycoplasmatota bacterium]